MKLREIIERTERPPILSVDFVARIVWQESKGEPHSYRYEDGAYIRYVSGKARANLLGHVPKEWLVSLPTEKRVRAMSWGVMHVLGQTARELGYDRDTFIDMAAYADISVHYGVLYLKKCLGIVWKAGGSEKDLLVKIANQYNGNGNPLYGPEVMRASDGDIEALLERDYVISTY